MKVIFLYHLMNNKNVDCPQKLLVNFSNLIREINIDENNISIIIIKF